MMLTKRMIGLKQIIAICLVSVCAALTSTSAYAQDKNVTGVILDETDTGVPGAFVVVKGETRGAMTDDQGRFNITVSPKDVLVASFLGYLDEESNETVTSAPICKLYSLILSSPNTLNTQRRGYCSNVSIT